MCHMAQISPFGRHKLLSQEMGVRRANEKNEITKERGRLGSVAFIFTFNSFIIRPDEFLRVHLCMYRHFCWREYFVVLPATLTSH